MQSKTRSLLNLRAAVWALTLCAAGASLAHADTTADRAAVAAISDRAAVAAISDRAAVAALDTRYQAAVAANDAEAMDAILAEDFVLVTGVGKTYTRKDLLDSARNKAVVYERQEEIPGTQTVRVWNDTAVVTARLWLKGVQAGQAFDYQLWFSDTYVRTASGWRYAFGQAAQRLAPGQ